MGTITIRNIDDTVKASLRIQAAHNGHSMEEEARQILAQALQTAASTAPPLGLGTRLRQHFTGVGELTIAPRGAMRTPPDFSSDMFTARGKRK
jgi:antitoxin FitA